jgi:hypothetical protein
MKEMRAECPRNGGEADFSLASTGREFSERIARFEPLNFKSPIAGSVAQVGNLLYRRLVIGGSRVVVRWPVANRRYSRMPFGATLRPEPKITPWQPAEVHGEGDGSVSRIYPALQVSPRWYFQDAGSNDIFRCTLNGSP